MGSLRKMKRDMGKGNPSLMNLKLLEQIAYDRGYECGAAEQRKLDIQSVTNLLNGLEELPGIGAVTANKIRYLVASRLERMEGE
jgi:hypothetical protein